jgi:hypothetical protein
MTKENLPNSEVGGRHLEIQQIILTYSRRVPDKLTYGGHVISRAICKHDRCLVQVFQFIT